MINVDVSTKIQEKFCEKGYIWNPATCNCENGRNAKSIVDDAGIICHEIISCLDACLVSRVCMYLLQQHLMGSLYSHAKVSCTTLIVVQSLVWSGW